MSRLACTEVKPFAALDEGDGLEFWANSKPKCPHCGDDFDIQDNEAWFLYDENDSHDVECPSCNQDFLVNSSASWSFDTSEQDRDA